MKISTAALLLVAVGTAMVPIARSFAERNTERSRFTLAGQSLRQDDRLVIEGQVAGAGTATLVLRIDDARSHDYASRANLERVFPTGPLRWSVPIGGHLTSGGRKLDLDSLVQALVFKAGGSARVRVTNVGLHRPQPLPEGARGYSLGAEGAPIPAGFVRIAPGHDWIIGGTPEIVRRPMPDPLAASGLRGLDRLRIPWPSGRVRVTVWADDPGEWELLPHPLQRRILVNGRAILDERLSAAEWVRHRYLRGAQDEHGADDDSWTAFGRHRARWRSVEVDVTTGGIEFSFQGGGPHERYLAAVLVEPAGSTTARDHVERDRARWYRENWPVLSREIGAEDGETESFALAPTGGLRTRRLRTRLAPGTGARLRVRVDGMRAETVAELRFSAPDRLRRFFEVRIWAARQRLERRRAQHSYLTLTDNLLQGSGRAGAVRGSSHRLFELWISAAPYTPAGRHVVALSLTAGGTRRTVPLMIDVLDVRIPDAPKPVGVYLDESPHIGWFADFAGARRTQIACDLRLVTALGLTGSAPALSTPLKRGDSFMSDMRIATSAGLAAPALAYAPAKRVFEELGSQAGAAQLATISRRLAAEGLPAPVWSIADEPSNAGSHGKWRSWLEAIRRETAPGVLIAGHLNARSDRALVRNFDVALINAGFGLDAATIAAAADSGTEIWLYNTEAPRLAAGGWLWQTAARRYVQWHARMPTAHPFDPLDGREGDEQLLLPSNDGCPALISIHRDLLDLADGVLDQRWLAWLDTRGDPGAKKLRASLRARLGGRWIDAVRLTRSELGAIRNAIMDFAAAHAKTVTAPLTR